MMPAPSAITSQATRPTTRLVTRWNSGRIWLLQAVIAALLMPGPALLLAGVLTPAIGIRLAMDRPARELARTMALFGLAGGMPVVLALLAQGGELLFQGVGTAFDLAGGPWRIAVAWAWQAGGLLLAELLPLAVELTWQKQASYRRRQLAARRSALLEEWSLSDEP